MVDAQSADGQLNVTRQTLLQLALCMYHETLERACKDPARPNYSGLTMLKTSLLKIVMRHWKGPVKTWQDLITVA